MSVPGDSMGDILMDPTALQQYFDQGLPPMSLGAVAAPQGDASFADKLAGLNGNPRFRFAGMLNAGGPSATPVGIGQAVAEGQHEMQQARPQGGQGKPDPQQLIMALARLLAAQHGAGAANFETRN